MNQKEEILINLLKEGIIRNTWDEFEDLTSVLALCAKQKIGPIVFDCLESHNDPIPDYLHQETQKSVLQFWHLFTVTKQLCDLLENNHIAAAVLKGISAARDYPVMEYRKSGDVDLLVRKEDIGKAEELLLQKGYRRNDEQKALHHVAFRGQDGIEVEVHTLFAEPFDSSETNRKLKYYSNEALNHIVYSEIEGVTFPLLDDTYQALSLLLHMLQHYLRAGFGLKLLADWTVFWNKRYTPELFTSYTAIIKDLMIDGFSDLVSSVCIRYLGLKKEHMPCVLMEKDVCEAFIDEVFEGGEFGRSSTDRMVSLRRNTLPEYIREFHHQTCLNYPQASKVFLFWPILWIVTLIRFLINNKKVRNTSLIKILRNTSQRSRINEKIHLFSEDIPKKS